MEEIFPSEMYRVFSKFYGEIDINLRLNGSISDLYTNAFDLCFDMCLAFYQSPEIKEWLNRPNIHYYLIMLDSTISQCGYGVIHKFKTKHILFMPARMPYHLDTFGLLPESASIPTTNLFGMVAMGGIRPLKACCTQIVKLKKKKKIVVYQECYDESSTKIIKIT